MANENVPQPGSMSEAEYRLRHALSRMAYNDEGEYVGLGKADLGDVTQAMWKAIRELQANRETLSQTSPPADEVGNIIGNVAAYVTAHLETIGHLQDDFRRMDAWLIRAREVLDLGTEPRTSPSQLQTEGESAGSKSSLANCVIERERLWEENTNLKFEHTCLQTKITDQTERISQLEAALKSMAEVQRVYIDTIRRLQGENEKLRADIAATYKANNGG